MTYHHGDLADALRDVAFREVRSHGAGKLSLRAVTREVGVDVAAAYRHYKNKSALLDAVASQGFEALAARMVGASEGVRDPVVRMGRIGDAYVTYALDEPHLFRLMFSARDPAAPRRGPNAYALLEGAVQDLVAAGACRLPLTDAAEVAWSAVHGLAVLAIDGPFAPEQARRRIPALVGTVCRGLL